MIRSGLKRIISTSGGLGCYKLGFENYSIDNLFAPSYAFMRLFPLSFFIIVYLIYAVLVFGIRFLILD